VIVVIVENLMRTWPDGRASASRRAVIQQCDGPKLPRLSIDVRPETRWRTVWIRREHCIEPCVPQYHPGVSATYNRAINAKQMKQKHTTVLHRVLHRPAYQRLDGLKHGWLAWNHVEHPLLQPSRVDLQAIATNMQPWTPASRI
jgi:hypothetical protein